MDGVTLDLLSTCLSSSDAQLLTAEQRRAVLTRVIRQQVVPTLLQRASFDPVECSLAVEQLADLCLHGDTEQVTKSVIISFQEDRNAERLSLDLLAPTARFLGDCWVDDRCTFLDVTIGVGRLETALRAVQASLVNLRPVAPASPRRILLMPVPGGQHSLGLSMLAGFFARAGWDADIVRVEACFELPSIVAAWPVDVVGFSLSHSELLDTARDAIALVRAEPHVINPVVMIGGPLLIENPSLADELGADGTATDGAEAVVIASALLRSPPRRGR